MATNPFAQQPAPAPSKYRDSVDHMQAINYVFENPNWLMNVLWVGLAILSGGIIPIVGQLVIHGYQFAIIEALHLRPHETYPDFDFDNIGDYLMTGVWVFLVTLLLMLVTMPITMAVVFMFFMLVIGGAAIGGEDAAGIAALISMPLFILFTVFFSIAINMFMIPFVLRAGLTKDFGQSFDFGFAMQFVKNTWLQMIITGIVFVFVFLILELLGFLLFCVGIFFTLAVGMLFQAHLGLQLYEVHLSRGGDPIPIKPSGVK